MSNFIRFKVLGYKYMLIASKKISCCLLLILNQFSLITITHR
jgi:hypothetical protein